MRPHSLPLRPSLEHLQKQAKALLKAVNEGDRDAALRFLTSRPALAKASVTEIASAKLSLRDAQATIAREYGFETWSDLKKRVTELSQSDPVEVETMETAIYTPAGYTDRIRQGLGSCLTKTNVSEGEKIVNKVRDRHDLGDRTVLITTDRQSAFDRVLAAVPFKGQALNLTSAWWFEQTRHIVPNHVLSIPDPNVTITKTCTVFPIEFVVRGYITGTTSTALWTVYQSGQRQYCGIDLPDGLVKNQKLPSNILTPTTKGVHDRPISPDEIVSENWMTADAWEQCSRIAQQLFAFGQAKAAEHGLILVDTKYEMGRDKNGEILLVDEIHTPDSSRYWIADTYEQRMQEGQEPDNVDKEFLRLWFTENCDPYEDEVLPSAPDDLVVELSRRYIYLYEKITGRSFEFPEADQPIETRLASNLRGIT